MPDAQTSELRAIPSASARLNWPLIRARCAELGARTNRDAARLMGMAPRTLDRLRYGSAATSIETVLQMQEMLGLSLDDMFPRPAKRRRSSLTDKAAA
ncbi:helix-turn-helix transcriptional regulator [Micromonospora sp. WMMD1102]|uniref:helix-turn-helix transcriptional regulator n=2 Tax=Micromonosporaceae TaxID=28056 RepID=UPI002414FE98|nr:helix-turn-helix transcriptional regulator [Micromonospora sp. WMMD1102]MDG4791920.1 helix-turn-helix transcriptional regulator [Micromonospora sp. WMMD1102]